MLDKVIDGSLLDSNLTAIADEIRKKRNIKDKLPFPEGFVNGVKNIRLGIPIDVSVHINPETGEWERPSDWPDLDAIEIPEDFDGVYLTYDLKKTPGYGWIGVYVRLNKNGVIGIERGHIEGNTFVADYSTSISTTGYFREPLDEENGDVQIWRVYSTDPDVHIIRFGFCTNTNITANNFNNNMQPCVERVGTLPWVTGIHTDSISTTHTHVCYGTAWLERDAVVVGKKSVVTAMNGCWQNCYSLQSLDVSGWDTTNWAVTTLYCCWNGCYSLQSLDVSGWDTTNWAVTDSRTIISGYRFKVIKTPISLGLVSTAGNANGVPNLVTLEDFTGYEIYQNHSYDSAYKLTSESLVSILTRLPVVTAARTITLGQVNKLKLTDEQIAIATQKGWTVA